MADERFKNALESALKKFDLPCFRELQIRCLSNLVNGRDVLVIQPTGSGKSLVFQSFPLICDFMKTESEDPVNVKSIALVVSPLASLMQDQVSYLLSKGVHAAFIGEEQADEQVKINVESGKFQLLYGSPESFLYTKRWRNMLTTDVYQKNVKLIAVDEAHCISHWGLAPKKCEKVFRKWFSRINELRSIVLSYVPLVALTATATKNTRAKIVEILCMQGCELVIEIPDMKNICYC